MHEPLPRRTIPPVDTAVAHVLHRDYETRSRASLQQVGVSKYSADASTEVLLAAYCLNDGPVQLWRPGDPAPVEFHEAAANPNWLVAAHNDGFESSIELRVLHPRFNWPIVPIERHRCTMAAGLALGLPAKLSLAADVLELTNRKDSAGERLMHQMSKPRRARQGEDPAGIYWFDDEERLHRLAEYCRQDVEVERELHDRLPPLSAAEQALWVLSCRINAFGFHIDRPFAEAMRRMAQALAPEIDAELSEITGGAVVGINQIARLQQWLRSQSCLAPKLDRKAVEQLLAKDLPPKARRALELRLGGAQAAIAKSEEAYCRGSCCRYRCSEDRRS